MALVGLWLVFTVSLATWWLIFGLRQASLIRALDHDEAPRLERVQRMLLWEGAVLVGALLAGGVALLYHVRQETKRHRQIEEFFAAFTHDLKTSLASFRLQVECLQENPANEADRSELLSRLAKDSVRLQLQLENSLFFANLRRGRLHIEPVTLGRIVDSVRHHWPDLRIDLNRDCVVAADSLALEIVMRNILQNAVIHGEADRMDIHVGAASGSRIQIRMADNGHGTQAEFSRLGELFYRPTATSGTGVGLFLTRQLMARMGGALRILPPEGGGFRVELHLGGRLA